MISILIPKLKQNFRSHFPAVLIFFIASILIVPYTFNLNYTVGGSDAISFADGYRVIGERMKSSGEMVLWNPNIFSGVPTTAAFGWLTENVVVQDIMQMLQQLLHVRSDFFIFFICCIFFYIFAKSLRIKTNVAIIGALGYSFSTYNAIIVLAAHTGKFIAMAYLPMIAAGIIFVLEGLLIEGLLIIICFAYGLFAHQQIAYYVFIVLLTIGVTYAWQHIQDRKILYLVKRGTLIIVAAFIGLACIIPTNLTLLDYNKQSMRAGTLKLGDTAQTNASAASGLDIDYAFSWSCEKMETLTMWLPGVYGYGSKGMKFDKGAKMVEVLNTNFGMPLDQALESSAQFAGLAYWGSSPFVEGPVYFGVLICLLALIAIGFCIKSNKHVGWLLVLTVLSILMAWGKHFMWFNELLFDYLPFYNKLRVPFMALVITQFSVVALATIGADYLVSNYKLFFAKFTDPLTKKLLIITASFFMVGVVAYVSLDYTDMDGAVMSKLQNVANQGRSVSPNELNSILMSNATNNGGNHDIKNFSNFFQMTRGNMKSSYALLDALIQDRQNAVFDNIVYSLWIIVIFLVLLYLCAKGITKPMVLVVGMGILVYGDLLYVDKAYLNKNFYQEAGESNLYVPKKLPVDEQILQDKNPNYRVLNNSSDRFNENGTSAFHKSIGGYHPAKLALYQDLITYNLSDPINPEVLNMLNTKYIINGGGRNAANAYVSPNLEANGNCWFVQQLQPVADARAEMSFLKNSQLNTKKMAIVQQQYLDEHNIRQMNYTQGDEDYIRQTYYSYDTIRYGYSSTTPQFAVFSEIYSPYWKAFDEKGVALPVIKTDYALRALHLPAGKHTIEFQCVPELYYKLKPITTTLYYLNLLAIIALLGILFVKQKKQITLNTKNT